MYYKNCLWSPWGPLCLSVIFRKYDITDHQAQAKNNIEQAILNSIIYLLISDRQTLSKVNLYYSGIMGIPWEILGNLPLPQFQFQAQLSLVSPPSMECAPSFLETAASLKSIIPPLPSQTHSSMIFFLKKKCFSLITHISLS